LVRSFVSFLCVHVRQEHAAHVELAGDGAGDQVGAVLADQVDLALGAGDELV
jgi:hypothetical protein